MNIQPKIRGFISASAHPEGCFAAVEQQINYVMTQGAFAGPKNVLVIGSSTGYGLASLIVSIFGANAKAIGVFFEREADDKRTASAGWYNMAALEKIAHQEGYYVKSVNGDAFSDEIKEKTAALISKDLEKIDLIIYSVASPRRTSPETGETFTSVLKPIGKTFTSKTVEPFRGEVKEVTIQPATDDEIRNTVGVMGGEDWERWLDYLNEAGLLAEGVITVNYSYIGPELTHDIYKNGTIGRAKDDMRKKAALLNEKLHAIGGQAIVSVNKAVVTQASAAIPVVPLYISLLFKVMKEMGTHEGCIEQIYRLFFEFLYGDKKMLRDAAGFIRLDDREMAENVQNKIKELWPLITTENLSTLTDIAGYCQDFQRLFGFDFAGVDYAADVNPVVPIESLESE